MNAALRFVFWIYLLAMSVYLIAPIAIVVVSAFTAGDFITFPPAGLSVRWFEKVLADPEFVRPLWNSVRLATLSTLVSSVLAVPAALALSRVSVLHRGIAEAFFLAPLSLPTIILAVGLLFFSARLGFLSSFGALLAGHVVLIVPYILRTVIAVHANMNRESEDAARVLGANGLKTFWFVTLPMLRPGIIAGAIFAFLMSFDEVAVALLLTDSGTTTLPVSILSYLVYNYDPAVAAISTIQIAIIVIALLLLERLIGLKNVVFVSR